MGKISQKDIVLNHLKKYGSISTMECYEIYRITDLQGGEMNKKYFKENILIVTYGLIMFFLISNLKYVSHVIDNLIEIILPVIFGCVLAFFLNMPMSFLEKKIIILPTNG